MIRASAGKNAIRVMRNFDRNLRVVVRSSVTILSAIAAFVLTLPSTSSGQVTDPSTSTTTTKPSLFFDPEDGALDISYALATQKGFLPLVIPITEPAVGYGAAVVLTFFHDTIQIKEGKDGQRARAVLPSVTFVGGGLTENGTWFTGFGHLGNWFENRVHYAGGVGYAAAKLDWYGQSDALNGHALAYENDVFFLTQRIMFDLGESHFYVGPAYRFIGSDSSFDLGEEGGSGINSRDFDSKTSGLGLTIGFDNRDQPFSPRIGIKSEVTFLQHGEYVGGDYNYGRLNGYVIGYVPLGEDFTLGLRLDNANVTGDAPFYDLANVMLRGIPYGRFVDDSVLVGEAELRWDVTRRWTLVGFGGDCRSADNFGDLFDADDHFAVGTGFRYLIARTYGLRMGLDVAYGDDDVALYVTVGTGWVRP